MIEKKKEVRKSESVKSVPGVVVSAKFIMQDKKNLKVKDQDGKEITMDELQNRSKEGGGAKKKLSLFKLLSF
jgi:tRNA splicing endonuclease